MHASDCEVDQQLMLVRVVGFHCVVRSNGGVCDGVVASAAHGLHLSWWPAAECCWIMRWASVLAGQDRQLWARGQPSFVRGNWVPQ